MSKYARIVNDEAVDVFDFDPAGLFTSDFVFEIVPDSVNRGDRRGFDANGQLVWSSPVIPSEMPIITPPAPNYGRIITRLAFLNRFTDAEAIAIDLASVGNTVEAATLRRNQSKITAAEEIHLDNSETRAGVFALETNGLITAGRAEVILDSPVMAYEVPALYRATYGLSVIPT